MTLEELDRKYAEAGWLIAKLSASAAGKALIFSNQSLEDAKREIAAVYALDEDDIDRLSHGGGDGAVAGVQRIAGGLFGQEEDPEASQAMRVARTAIRNGHAVKTISTFVKAGPQAAGAAAAGSAAARGTPWGWIATAAYAAGSAGWFAYNARAFSMEAYELVREREGIELPSEAQGVSDEVPDGSSAPGTVTLKIELPTASALASQASEVSGKAMTALVGALGKLRRLRT